MNFMNDLTKNIEFIRENIKRLGKSIYNFLERSKFGTFSLNYIL